MSEVPSPAADSARARSGSLREGVYRYFFYGWLFRDADHGSAHERAAALLHNRAQAKWLPLYIRRWCVAGVLMWGFETLSERLVGNAALSAVLAVALVLVVLFLLITVVSWAFLHVGRPSHSVNGPLDR